jgi:hypothetical protein
VPQGKITWKAETEKDKNLLLSSVGRDNGYMFL